MQTQIMYGNAAVPSLYKTRICIGNAPLFFSFHGVFTLLFSVVSRNKGAILIYGKLSLFMCGTFYHAYPKN